MPGLNHLKCDDESKNHCPVTAANSIRSQEAQFQYFLGVISGRGKEPVSYACNSNTPDALKRNDNISIYIKVMIFLKV